MTVASTFDLKYPEENVTLTFDFTAGMTGVQTLSSITSVSVAPYAVDGNLGTDPAPASLLNGAAALDGTAKMVLQPVKGGKPGVSYVFSVVAVRSDGAILELKGILPIAAV